LAVNQRVASKIFAHATTGQCHLLGFLTNEEKKNALKSAGPSLPHHPLACYSQSAAQSNVTFRQLSNQNVYRVSIVNKPK
jgi:hypothetical protein